MLAGENTTTANGRYSMQNKISINYTKTGYDVEIIHNGVYLKSCNLSVEEPVPGLRMNGEPVRLGNLTVKDVVGDLRAREVVDDKN